MDLSDGFDWMRNFLRGADCRPDESRVASPVEALAHEGADSRCLGTLCPSSNPRAEGGLPQRVGEPINSAFGEGEPTPVLGHGQDQATSNDEVDRYGLRPGLELLGWRHPTYRTDEAGGGAARW